MYKIVVQVMDTNYVPGNVFHEIHSREYSSIQEAMESYDGKQAFEVYLEIEKETMKSVNEITGR